MTYETIIGLFFIEYIFRSTQTEQKCAEFDSINSNAQNFSDPEILQQSLSMIAFSDDFSNFWHEQPG